MGTQNVNAEPELAPASSLFRTLCFYVNFLSARGIFLVVYRSFQQEGLGFVFGMSARRRGAGSGDCLHFSLEW